MEANSFRPPWRRDPRPFYVEGLVLKGHELTAEDVQTIQNGVLYNGIVFSPGAEELFYPSPTSQSRPQQPDQRQQLLDKLDLTDPLYTQPGYQNYPDGSV